MQKTLVMKFGGSSVATPAHFSKIADLIISRKKEFPKIVIVVSAMGNTTDQLIALAKEVNPEPPQREYDMLLTAGERISIALLAMALNAKKTEAVSFTGSQSGIITCDRHTNAQIIEVRPHRLLPHLEAGRVVIVAGFQGVSQKGEITTLGRGGSDTSAVALGVALNASRVEFFKDVPGICTNDPKINPHATLIQQLTYSEALIIANSGAKVMHPRSIQLASKNNIPLFVTSFSSPNSTQGTHIFEHATTSHPEPVYEL